MGKANNIKSINFNGISIFIISFALMAMIYAMMMLGIHIGFAIALIPIAIITVLAIMKKPFIGFTLMLIFNYFLIAIIRYAQIDGLSLIMDILIVFILIAITINRVFVPNEDSNNRFKPFNGLLIASFIWVLYCSLEIINPSAITGAWFLSRTTILYMFAISLLTFLMIDSFKKVESMLMIISVLTLIGVGKGLMQKFLGFDASETFYLNTTELGRTHLLATGTRYFSIFASAGIFGAVMGQAFVIYTIAAIYTRNNGRRIYFGIVALAAIYSLLISGTRGALAVPAAGFFLFILLSKQISIIIPTTIFFIGTYVFLAMTTIGQGNALIRRMRTAFNPNEPSLMVRKENQKRLGEYLINKPFGEGLGLSGVENKSISQRFTTSIPTDSWFVKIWVETGIVGLILHLGILVYVIMHGSYIILFKIKDKEIKGVLSGLLCGTVGIFASSYGNLVLGQYPVAIITYSSLAIVFMGQYYDSQVKDRLLS